MKRYILKHQFPYCFGERRIKKEMMGGVRIHKKENTSRRTLDSNFLQILTCDNSLLFEGPIESTNLWEEVEIPYVSPLV